MVISGAIVVANGARAAAQPAPAGDSPPPATTLSADAEPAASTAAAAEPAASADARSAKDWDSAPLPTEASGIARPDSKGASTLLWIPRVIFFVPKWAVIIVAQPFRGIAWAYERYQFRNRFDQVFFNDAGTFGIYPVAFFETGFGLNAGARLIHRDLFGDEERFRLRVSYGGRFRQIYSAKFGSGERLGDTVELELDAGLEIRPKDRFFGIGNSDDTAPGSVALPVDAVTGDAALDSRFRQEVVRVRMGTDFHLYDDDERSFAVKLSGAYMHRSFGGADSDYDDSGYIEDYYQTDSLVGFSGGLSNLYSEIELEYDSRRPTWEYLSNAVPATGWHLIGFAGYAAGMADDPSAYIRYGADLQRYVCIYGGSRILALRLFVEGVTGPIDEVPFVDLPPLGGPLMLRGYEQDRFRDRALTMASAEYEWGLGPSFSAALFVDSGRVWSSLGDVGFDDLRVGYGAALQMHQRHSFLFRFDVSSSIDGGLFFNLGFDPAFNVRDRAGRY